MRKLLLSISLLLTVIAHAQQHYQQEKRFVPFVEGSVGYAVKTMWTGFNGGIQNKNTQFLAGATSDIWEPKKNVAVFIGVSKRFFTAGRFEGWGTLSTSQNLEFNRPVSFNPLGILRWHGDKALNLSLRLGTNLSTDNFDFTELQPSFAVGIPLHGDVHKP